MILRSKFRGRTFLGLFSQPKQIREWITISVFSVSNSQMPKNIQWGLKIRTLQIKCHVIPNVLMFGFPKKMAAIVFSEANQDDRKKITELDLAR